MIKEQLAAIITQALEAAKADGDLALESVPAVTLEMPKQKAHGDWATGVALGLARTLGMPPRDVAARIVSHLPIGDDALIAAAEIAGPGFINLRLRPDWLGDILKRIEAQGEQYGRAEAGTGQRIVVEFVSTNPNGPITVAGGRNAAIGDTLCSLLSAAGNEVSREYYINDALNSVQMNNFGRSVFLRYQELLGVRARSGKKCTGATTSWTWPARCWQSTARSSSMPILTTRRLRGPSGTCPKRA